eukprot:scaffold278259_cov39-Prasinocladus_malaysianus.AAC.1
MKPARSSLSIFLTGMTDALGPKQTAKLQERLVRTTLHEDCCSEEGPIVSTLKSQQAPSAWNGEARCLSP